MITEIGVKLSRCRKSNERVFLTYLIGFLYLHKFIG